MKIVIATHNKGKLQELQHVLHDFPFELVSSADLKIPEIEETGLTFVENALIKARNAAKFCKLGAIADDSGLVVPALKGAPGIYSARYAGTNLPQQAHIEKLLHDAKDLSGEQRRAAFICVLVFITHPEDPMPIIAQATWEGLLLTECVGENGFGYDPIFYIPELNQSAAQIAPQVKNKISHRAKATELFRKAFFDLSRLS